MKYNKSWYHVLDDYNSESEDNNKHTTYIVSIWVIYTSG